MDHSVWWDKYVFLSIEFIITFIATWFSHITPICFPFHQGKHIILSLTLQKKEKRNTIVVNPTFSLSASTTRSRRSGTLASFCEALKASPISETSTWDWNRKENVPHQKRVLPARPALLTADKSTHKLLALEKVAVVGVCCRVSCHEAEDLRSERQHSREGDGGERAGVEQELGDAHQKEEVSWSWTGRRRRMLAQTLVLFSRMSTPLRDRKRWTLLFFRVFSVEYSSGVWTRGEAVTPPSKVLHRSNGGGSGRLSGANASSLSDMTWGHLNPDRNKMWFLPSDCQLLLPGAAVRQDVPPQPGLETEGWTKTDWSLRSFNNKGTFLCYLDSEGDLSVLFAVTHLKRRSVERTLRVVGEVRLQLNLQQNKSWKWKTYLFFLEQSVAVASQYTGVKSNRVNVWLVYCSLSCSISVCFHHLMAFWGFWIVSCRTYLNHRVKISTRTHFHKAFRFRMCWLATLSPMLLPTCFLL